MNGRKIFFFRRFIFVPYYALKIKSVISKIKSVIAEIKSVIVRIKSVISKLLSVLIRIISKVISTKSNIIQIKSNIIRKNSKLEINRYRDTKSFFELNMSRKVFVYCSLNI
jgi:hypothetical protein